MYKYNLEYNDMTVFKIKAFGLKMTIFKGALSTAK
jgi:hypothetical protein